MGSDRHGGGEDLVNVVQIAESDVEDRYNTTITKTVHAGDLVDSGNATSTLNSYRGLQAINDEFRQALPQLAEDGSDNFYTYGHEHDQSVTSDAVANHFLDSAGQSGSTSPTRDTGVKELGDWGYLCGKAKTETAAARGHIWQHYKKAAGLLRNGTEYDYCTVCKIKKNVKTLKGYATLLCEEIQGCQRIKKFHSQVDEAQCFRPKEIQWIPNQIFSEVKYERRQICEGFEKIQLQEGQQTQEKEKVLRSG